MSTFTALQRLLPHHLLSRFGGFVAGNSNRLLSQALIRGFARVYNTNLGEAERTDPGDYTSFNDFFTRSLQPDARPLDGDPLNLVSPADGVISECGAIVDDRLLQAKGIHYSLSSLLLGARHGFNHGAFATIYLAPRDYHRVHLPMDATLKRTIAVPGELFSVNNTTTKGISQLFCRNERLIMRFDTGHGPMAVVMVGAMIVASIETVWSGPPSPYTREVVTHYNLPMSRGEEIGRFLLGSTVIVCLSQGMAELASSWQAGTPVHMGEAMARLTPW